MLSANPDAEFLIKCFGKAFSVLSATGSETKNRNNKKALLIYSYYNF